MLSSTDGSVAGHHDCVFYILSTYIYFCILLTILTFLFTIYLQKLACVVFLQSHSTQSLITKQNSISRRCVNVSHYYAAELHQSYLVIHVNPENCIIYLSKDKKSHHNNGSHSSRRLETGIP